MAGVGAFHGFKIQGVWHWETGEKERLAAHIESLADGPWEMPPARRLTRSARANAYYWSTVLPLLAKENEQTPDEMHDCMCALFLPNETKRVEFFHRMTGEVLTIDLDTRRSSKLTGVAFYDFVERVRLWGMEFLGVFTPDPDPDYWRKRERRKSFTGVPELQS